MTHVVTDKCIKCKYTDCVVVCPVDCFYDPEGLFMLVIDPDTCIDCGVCIPECPVGAIEVESEDNIRWLEINKKYSQQSSNITEKKPALLNADQHREENNKWEKYVETANILG